MVGALNSSAIAASGLRGLDAPVADYLPKRGLDKRITVRMLLQHHQRVVQLHRRFRPRRGRRAVHLEGGLRSAVAEHRVGYFPLRFDCVL